MVYLHKFKTFLLFLFFTSFDISYSEASLDLYLFNVGHGNFILLKDDEQALIVDAGSQTGNTWSSIENSFKTCLGKAKIEAIVKTHDHTDHKNFIEKINEIQQVAHIFTSDDEKINDCFKNIKFKFLRPKISLAKLKDEDQNDKSLVFSVSYKNENILFTGDATGMSFNNYLSQYDNNDKERTEANRGIVKETTLYIMPHHGSSSENSWRWTLYIASNCKKLKATFICCQPNNPEYHLPKDWIRDISWPESMRSFTKRPLKYHLEKEETLHCKNVPERFYVTGLASDYNDETHDYIHLNINDDGEITYPDTKTGPQMMESSVFSQSEEHSSILSKDQTSDQNSTDLSILIESDSKKEKKPKATKQKKHPKKQKSIKSP